MSLSLVAPCFQFIPVIYQQKDSAVLMKFIADPPTNTLQRLKGMLMVSPSGALFFGEFLLTYGSEELLDVF